jgi:hypothetical protein
LDNQQTHEQAPGIGPGGEAQGQNWRNNTILGNPSKIRNLLKIYAFRLAKDRQIPLKTSILLDFYPEEVAISTQLPQAVFYLN